MGIYEKYKGSGIYYIKYPYSKDPSTDKIRYKIEKVGPKKLAERFFNKKMTEWAEKKFYGRDYDISFSDLVDWYLARKEVKSKKSFQKDKQHCATLKKTLGNHTAYDIKNHMVREFRDKLRRTMSKRGSLYADSTINRILQVGRHMYNLGLDNGILFCPNPFNGALLPERNSRARILSWEEFLGLI